MAFECDFCCEFIFVQCANNTRASRSRKKFTMKMNRVNKRSLCVATSVVLAVVIAALLGPVVEAHVALTFPPARKYDLDFLDNSRTKGPCGMPKGE